MKIVNARVDERLIHGQVAMVWTNILKADRIVVVNDEAIKDEMQIAALKIAKPAGVKLSLLSKEKAVIRFRDNSYEGQSVFIITKNIMDMAFLVNEIPLVEFNVGNIAKRAQTRTIKPSVSITQQEEKILLDLLARGIHIRAQMLPTESDESIAAYL